MSSNELVKNFKEQSGNAGVSVTEEYSLPEGKNLKIPMLGTYVPVSGLGWAVVAQKTQEDSYRDITDIQRTELRFALFAIATSILIGIWAARRFTLPLQVLTESSRAIAGGDFSQRFQLKSRTEFGELAETFNSMTDDLQPFVSDLKKAAEETPPPFTRSFQRSSGAV